VVVRDGANDQGQGHRSTWARLIERATGLGGRRIELEHGDTGVVPTGEGTGSARSMMLAGGAVAAAAEVVAEQARLVAAHLLEAAPADIVVDHDGCRVAGTPSRSRSWRVVVDAATDPALPLDVAAAIAARRGGLPGTGIGAAVDFEQPGPTFPSGCHGAVVEVDPETGAVHLRRFVAVDDCGTVIHPVLVEGQQHGGIAQGIAQALYEEMVYDADGNPLTSTFAEYAIPSAAEIPPLEAHVRPTPSPVNALGVRGIGQAGAIGSTVAVQNAVVDAVAHLGVRHIDLPLTPERVWRAIQDARR
jgi:carbon-monoxide dehydrogenase large subunit